MRTSIGPFCENNTYFIIIELGLLLKYGYFQIYWETTIPLKED